ncbi:MAG: polysaccharide deacetylase family protein [Clostridia bacterium]|nr:polysaccharide deacetylase family protein [Clostridia bacterium]
MQRLKSNTAKKFQPNYFHLLATITAFLFALLAVFSTISFCIKGSDKTTQTVGAGTSSTRLLPIYSVEGREKKISISFDCAWGVEYTQKLLDTMQEYGVRCTFFATQFWVEKYPEYVAKIVEYGHEIGTHSRTHSYMSKQSKAEILDELNTSSNAIERITGEKVTLFRPPYGDYDNELIETCKSRNLYPIQWDVDSLDWKNLSAAEIALRITGSAKDGSIILCHNNGLHTAEALPSVFSTLKKRGYDFVPIGELIYKEHYFIDRSGRQHPINGSPSDGAKTE